MKCKICLDKYEPKYFLQKCCSKTECMIAWSMQVVAKQKEDYKKKKKQEWNKEKIVLKEKLKTLSQYEAEAKKSFQKWIRLRDNNLPCISCGTKSSELVDGGHFKKAEIYSGVIFNENNCHSQCRKCNRFLGGNELMYREGLVKRYSSEFVESIEQLANETRQYKWTKEQLIAKKLQYDILIKEFK
jgi:hypothetical protein